MRKRSYFKKLTFLVVVGVLFALMISSCELQQSGSQPSTPTMGLEIPVVPAATKPMEEAEADMPAEEEADNDLDAKDVEGEETSEEEPTSAPTETPMPLPTSTEKPAESKDLEEETEEVAKAESTATAIPYIQTANKDPMVLIYFETSCYEYPDVESKVIGVAAGGTALGAFERQWNWYKVVHPTVGGLTCWMTGDSIRPNQTAFFLGN